MSEKVKAIEKEFLLISDAADAMNDVAQRLLCGRRAYAISAMFYRTFAQSMKDFKFLSRVTRDITKIEWKAPDQRPIKVTVDEYKAMKYIQ